jgi:hypothetical protein
MNESVSQKLIKCGIKVPSVLAFHKCNEVTIEDGEAGTLWFSFALRKLMSKEALV